VTLQEIIDESTRRESKVVVAQGIDPEFNTAVQALKTDALAFIGAPDSWLEECRVTGVSLSWDDSELAGAVVSVAMPVDGANGPLNISTPYAEITEGNTGLPKSFVAAIDAAIDAAENLVRTVAKQHELFE
jgi:hypothetical protein